MCEKLNILSFVNNDFLLFQLPPNAPASVTLQPAPGDTGKVCTSYT